MHARARNGACCRVRGGPVERTVARRGGFLADGILALLVLGLALGAGLPTLAWTVRMQRTLERRQLALLTVANGVLTRVCSKTRTIKRPPCLKICWRY